MKNIVASLASNQRMCHDHDPPVAPAGRPRAPVACAVAARGGRVDALLGLVDCGDVTRLIMKRKETDIAASIIAWLEAQEWETYKEVMAFHSGQRADIVATKGNLIWVIETKTTLTFEVISQALGWKGFAHFISIGLPERLSKSSGRTLAESFVHDCRLGIIIVGKNHVHSKPPPINREIFMIDYMRRGLIPQRKSSIAGNANHDYYTPWRETCERLAKVVKANPGISMKDAVTELKHHHYCSDATAIASLRQWLRAGKLKGIEGRIEAGKLKLYPSESQCLEH